MLQNSCVCREGSIRGRILQSYIWGLVLVCDLMHHFAFVEKERKKELYKNSEREKNDKKESAILYIDFFSLHNDDDKNVF